MNQYYYVGDENHAAGFCHIIEGFLSKMEPSFVTVRFEDGSELSQQASQLFHANAQPLKKYYSQIELSVALRQECAQLMAAIHQTHVDVAADHSSTFSYCGECGNLYDSSQLMATGNKFLCGFCRPVVS